MLDEKLPRKTKKDNPQFSEDASSEEKKVINDMRGLNFGRVTIHIQNGNIVSKEITKTVKIKNNKP